MSSCFISAANIVLPGNIFPISELIRRKLKTHNSQNSHRATHLTSPRVPDNYRWELWRCLWNGNVQHFRYSPEKRANKNQRQVSNLNNDSQIGKMAANPDKTRIVYASFFFFFLGGGAGGRFFKIQIGRRRQRHLCIWVSFNCARVRHSDPTRPLVCDSALGRPLSSSISVEKSTRMRF